MTNAAGQARGAEAGRLGFWSKLAPYRFEAHRINAMETHKIRMLVISVPRP